MATAGGSFQTVVEDVAGDSVIVDYSQTIGDYTSPSSATSTSDGTGLGGVLYNFDTAGTTVNVSIYSSQPRAGNKITNATLNAKPITSCVFSLSKTGSPTGTCVARVRLASDDSIIATSSTLDVSTITGSQANYAFTFAGETLPSAAFRIAVEYTGGDGSNYVNTFSSASNVVANMDLTYYNGSAWTEIATSDTRGSLTYTDTITLTASFAVDGSTSTRWKSTSSINPAIYFDMGSALNLCAVAIYLHSDNTETQIKIRLDSDTTFADANNVRTINVTSLTAGAWNYIRFPIQTMRYLQIIGSSGIAKVLAITEVKVMTKTDAQLKVEHGHLVIDSTNTLLGLDGT